MSDPNPTPTPTPVPQPVKPNVTHGIINQRQQQSLDKAGLVTAAAKKAEYAPLLVKREISAAFVNQLEADIAACKAHVGRAVDLTSDLRVATGAEGKAHAALANALKEIQAAAKQKYSRTTPQLLKDYFVGVHPASSRVSLVQATDAVAEKLKTDKLPGIDAAKIAGLKTLRDAYVASNTIQSDTQSKATSERNGIESAVQSINDRRAQIQLAADAQWPANVNGNAPIRREFQLLPNRSFNG